MEKVSIGRLTTDFIFSGDPVIVTAVPNRFTDKSTFRQVVVDVQCKFAPTGGDRSFQFVVSATGNDEEVVLDISSALRSTLAGWQYDADSVKNGGSINYPYLQFYVNAHEREMTMDGIVTDYAATKEPSGDGVFYRAYLGRVGEYDRWRYGGATVISIDGSLVAPNGKAFSFTSKPEGEIFATGQLACNTKLTNNIVTTTFATAAANDTRERKVFLFVNSYGVFETISVLTREAMSYEVASARHSLSQSPSYTPKPSIAAYKQGGGAVWQMSSGYVNRDWADWFASEFLMARHYWMQHDGKWLPVVVEPDGDTVMVYDSNDPSLMAVNFTVRSAVSGSVR